MLPKFWFSKPIFGHSSGSTKNWTGPIANVSEVFVPKDLFLTYFDLVSGSPEFLP